MPGKPYVFKNVPDAIQKLKKFGLKFEISLRNENELEIMNSSIGANIFRALPCADTNPSEIYRNWATKNFKTIVNTLSKIRNRNEYDDTIYDFSVKLIREWKLNVKNPNERLGFGPAVKIINLLIKRIQESKTYRIARLQKFMHVPFDLFSLLPLKTIINDISDLDYKIVIPKNVSMSYITTKELYQIFHKSICRICKKAGIDPIMYDYWSWNRTHQ